MVEAAVRDAAIKVNRAGVQGSISTETVASQEREILITPMVPEHSMINVKAGPMLTGQELPGLQARPGKARNVSRLREGI